MRDSRTRVVLVLGSTQTLAWASSYYLPAIVADPISRDLGIPTGWFFAAFSVSLLISAIQARDYPLITGTVLTYTIAFVVINFAIDILYAWIDPRIRFGR